MEIERAPHKAWALLMVGFLSGVELSNINCGVAQQGIRSLNFLELFHHRGEQRLAGEWER